MVHDTLATPKTPNLLSHWKPAKPQETQALAGGDHLAPECGLAQTRAYCADCESTKEATRPGYGFASRQPRRRTTQAEINARQRERSGVSDEARAAAADILRREADARTHSDRAAYAYAARSERPAWRENQNATTTARPWAPIRRQPRRGGDVREGAQECAPRHPRPELLGGFCTAQFWALKIRRRQRPREALLWNDPRWLHPPRHVLYRREGGCHSLRKKSIAVPNIVSFYINNLGFRERVCSRFVLDYARKAW